VSGMFYGDSYTVEESVLELLHAEHSKTGILNGCFVMFSPDDRKNGLRVLKKFDLQNVFLDTTLSGDTKANASIFRELLTAVEEADAVMGSSVTNNKDSHQPCGQIYVNFANLMDIINVEVDADDFEGYNPDAKHAFEDAFDAFLGERSVQNRISAILFQDSRGKGAANDYKWIARWLTKRFRAIPVLAKGMEAPQRMSRQSLLRKLGQKGSGQR